jgi:predicted  nucleic acid-binding Zn-ribbon protein
MKGIQQVTSIKEVKSMHSVGARSIPKAQRSAYLDLYINRREKDRLEKEIFVLDKRRNTAKRLLDSINKRIEKLQTETHEEQKVKTYRNIPTKPLKTLSIQY